MRAVSKNTFRGIIMGGRYENKKRKKNKKNNALKKAFIIVGILVGLILAAVLAGVGYYNAMLNKINHVTVEKIAYTQPTEETTEPVMETETEAAETTVPEETTEATQPPHVASSEDYINFLVVGQAAREGEEERFADTMLLCSLNTYTKTLTTISILRDSYVPSFNYKGRSGGGIKLNTIYHLGSIYGDGIAGSMELMNMVLNSCFGIEVDHNIELNFDAFILAVNALGGLDIELDAAEAKYMNEDGYMLRYQYPTFEPGMAHLDGLAALVYARMRHADGDGDSDVVRTNRQRAVIESVLNKLKSSSLSEVQKLINEVLPLISTSMTNSEITEYLLRFLPMLPELEFVNGGTCPAKWWGEMVEIYHDGVWHSMVKYNQAETIKTMRQITEGEMP